MQPIIRVEGLSKRYRIAHAASDSHGTYRTLREDLVRLANAPLRRLRGGDDGLREDFWALRDVNFEVHPGEVVGIVGRNGAGKSTLLKILSRITKPTTGQAELRGRVGSLLEVGTGFHPELTGRENIFLNGAILGMSRREIAAKFDEIVAFSEIDRFLDTPVKRYSSGMYVRLAFAVAAHMDPEILIVDEVLAVGDIGFQRKCMGRMNEVGRGGTTVIFVSHNMPAVEALCERALLFEGGQCVRDGNIVDVISEYRRRTVAILPEALGRVFDRQDPHRSTSIFRSATLLDCSAQPTNYVALGGRFHLRIGLTAEEPIELPTIGIGIDDTLGQRVLSLHTPQSNEAVKRILGNCTVDCRVDPLPLVPGDYRLRLVISMAGCPLDAVEGALHFSVVNGEAFGEGRGFHRGLCVAPSKWTLTGTGVDETTTPEAITVDGLAWIVES